MVSHAQRHAARWAHKVTASGGQGTNQCYDGPWAGSAGGCPQEVTLTCEPRAAREYSRVREYSRSSGDRAIFQTWPPLSATSCARHADDKPLMQVPPPHRPLSRQFRQCDGDRRGLSVTQFGLRSLLTVLKPASKPLSRSKKDPPD